MNWSNFLKLSFLFLACTSSAFGAELEKYVDESFATQTSAVRNTSLRQRHTMWVNTAVSNNNLPNTLVKKLRDCRTACEVINLWEKCLDSHERNAFWPCLKGVIEQGTPMYDKNGQVVFWIPQFGLGLDCLGNKFCQEHFREYCGEKLSFIKPALEQLSIDDLKKMVPENNDDFNSEKLENKYFRANLTSRCSDGSTLLELLIRYYGYNGMLQRKLTSASGLTTEERETALDDVQKRLMLVSDTIRNIMVFFEPQKAQIAKLVRECINREPDVLQVHNLLEKCEYFEYFIGGNGENLILLLHYYDHDSELIDALDYRDAIDVLPLTGSEMYCTPLLCLARVSGGYDVAQLLLDYGAQVNARDIVDADCLQRYLENDYPSLDFVKLFARNRAFLNRIDDEDATLVHCAADRASDEVMRFLLEETGISINVQDEERCTPLHYLLESKSPNKLGMAKKLIQDYEANITLKNKWGVSVWDLMSQLEQGSPVRQSPRKTLQQKQSPKKRKRLEFEDTD